MISRPRLLYLCGAPRVTTAADCAEPGPRSHVLGMLGGFAAAGWHCDRLIAGDLLGTGRGASDGGRPKTWRRLVADAVRLAVPPMLGPLAAARARRCDLCYERLGLMQGLGAWARTRGVPWVVETQGLASVEASTVRRATALPALAATIERRTYRSCDLIVAVSAAVRDAVAAFADLPAERILVLPNGVDCLLVSPPPTGRQVKAHLTIGFVGTLLAWQGLDILLEAVAAVRRDGCDVRVAIAGDGAMRDGLEAQAGRLGLGPAAAFHGRIPHAAVSGFLADCDLGYSGQRAMPGGDMYHSPLKIYEYLAAGLPCLASSHDDARRVAAGVCDDLLFVSGDAVDLADRIRHAWSHRAELPRRGPELRRRAERDHGWRNRVGLLLARLAALATERR
jgi:glycosyltransferase involved in cell wall biosynthesis